MYLFVNHMLERQLDVESTFMTAFWLMEHKGQNKEFPALKALVNKPKFACLRCPKVMEYCEGKLQLAEPCSNKTGRKGRSGWQMALKSPQRRVW